MDAAGGYRRRTDQLLAGLERAVDPNADGSALDAARIALVGVAEPFASFPTGALAQAVSGAAELDTLVVAPAGNDGPAGPAYGSVSGPAGAPDALAVGAADGRAGLPTVRVLVRAGLAVLADGVVPLGGAVVPTRPLTLRLAAPRSSTASCRRTSEPPRPFSIPTASAFVAGRAALVSPKSEPQDGQRLAADAGAAAVVLERVAPAGALGLDERVGVPVVGIPSQAARGPAGARRRRRRDDRHRRPAGDREHGRRRHRAILFAGSPTAVAPAGARGGRDRRRHGRARPQRGRDGALRHRQRDERRRRRRRRRGRASGAGSPGSSTHVRSRARSSAPLHFRRRPA